MAMKVVALFMKTIAISTQQKRLRMDQFQERLALGETPLLVKVVGLGMLLPIGVSQEEAQDRGTQEIATDPNAF